MSDRFEYVSFGECNLNDVFFDSLKADYPEFSTWFQHKVDAQEKAYAYFDDNYIRAFGYLKAENESIVLSEKTLEAKNRIKI